MFAGRTKSTRVRSWRVGEKRDIYWARECMIFGNVEPFSLTKACRSSSARWTMLFCEIPTCHRMGGSSITSVFPHSYLSWRHRIPRIFKEISQPLSVRRHIWGCSLGRWATSEACIGDRHVRRCYRETSKASKLSGVRTLVSHVCYCRMCNPYVAWTRDCWNLVPNL